MNKLSFTAMAALGLGLAACGSADPESTSSTTQALGGGASDRALISFGDSLSDVGTYDVGTVKALGGGKYTVNSPSAKNWTEVLARDLGLPDPCPAETGLDGDPAEGFSAPVTVYPKCTNYAQGGARVTNPVGPGNALLGGSNAILGQLTVPVVTQIQNHLALHGSFNRNDVVTVLAGANDLFINLAEVGEGLDPTDAVTAMGQAAGELAGYVTSEILGKGAGAVLVINIPDVNNTPLGMSEDAATQGLIAAMVSTFNTELATALKGTKAILVDSYTFSQQEAAHPKLFGIDNITTPSCNLDPSVNPLGSSLICTPSTLVSGATPHWFYADTVHPTPYAYSLLADLVLGRLIESEL